MLQPVSKPEVAVPRYLPRIFFAHVVTERSIEYNLRVQVKLVVARVASAPASHRAYRPAAREREELTKGRRLQATGDARVGGNFDRQSICSIRE